MDFWNTFGTFASPKLHLSQSEKEIAWVQYNVWLVPCRIPDLRATRGMRSRRGKEARLRACALPPFTCAQGDEMNIFDSHLDLGWNAVNFNRDLTKSIVEIRKSEAGSKEKGRGTNT